MKENVLIFESLPTSERTLRKMKNDESEKNRRGDIQESILAVLRPFDL